MSRHTFLTSIAILGSALLLGSCASATKKICESTNWYEYGEGVAKSGKRVTGDSFVQNCEKEEAQIDYSGLNQGFKKGLDEYCTPTYAYITGKRGEYFSREMCEGRNEKDLLSRHQEGVREYCRPTNGMAAAGNGNPYNEICPQDLEEPFLVEFRKGRRNYLGSFVRTKSQEILALDREIADLNQGKSVIGAQIRRYETERLQLERIGYQALDPQQEKEIEASKDRINSSLSDLKWRLQQKESSINQLRARQRQIQEDIHKAEAERSTL